jgi:hypothetical protein
MALENKLATTVPTRQRSTPMPKKKTIKNPTLAASIINNNCCYIVTRRSQAIIN